MLREYLEDITKTFKSGDAIEVTFYLNKNINLIK